MFDLDGTLIDRQASLEPFLIGLYRRYKLGHIPYETYRDRFIELDKGGYADKHEVFQTLSTEFGVPVNAGELVTDYRRNAWKNCRVFPRTMETLAQLRKRGYKLGVVTNGTVESQQSKLRESGLDALVDAIPISEREQLKKPDPRIFARAADRLDVSVADCVFVGDNPEADIRGAHSVGMKTIWLIGDLPWPDDVDIVPSHTINSLPELLSIEF